MECTRRFIHLLKQRPMERKWCRRMESVQLPLSQECPSTVSSCRNSENSRERLVYSLGTPVKAIPAVCVFLGMDNASRAGKVYIVQIVCIPS